MTINARFQVLDALLEDVRPRAVVEAHTALVALRIELDRVIARLAA